MTVKNFYAWFEKLASLAQKVDWPTQPFDFQYLLDGQSELKILVSVVRFRPGPPRNSEPLQKWWGFLLFGITETRKTTIGQRLCGP